MKSTIILMLAVLLGAIGLYFFFLYPKDMTVSEPFPVSTTLTDDEFITTIHDMGEDDLSNLPEHTQKEMIERFNKISETMEDRKIEDQMPISTPLEIELFPKLLLSGTFKDADPSHRGTGNANLYAISPSEKILRFENFSVTNGPALSVLLVKNDDGTFSSSDEYINIGELKGNKGEQNYTIPENIDLSEYKSVLIYCVPFRVRFAHAPLQ